MLRRGPLLLAAVLAVASCSSDDGRALPPPAAHQTTTTPSPPSVPPSTGQGVAFALTSGSFADGAPLPERFTCAADDVSPDLAWTAAPPDAVELAVVARDQATGEVVHWVLAGIPPFVQGFGVGGIPEGAVEAANTTGAVGWSGPCPTGGSAGIELVLHALSAPSGVEPGMDAAEAVARVEAATESQAVLTAVADPVPTP